MWKKKTLKQKLVEALEADPEKYAVMTMHEIAADLEMDYTYTTKLAKEIKAVCIKEKYRVDLNELIDYMNSKYKTEYKDVPEMLAGVYQKYKSVPQIADLFGFSIPSMYRQFKIHNVKYKTTKERRKNSYAKTIRKNSHLCEKLTVKEISQLFGVKLQYTRSILAGSNIEYNKYSRKLG